MADQIYRSTISFLCGGNFCQVVHHWKTTGDPPNPFLAAKDLVDGFVVPSAGVSLASLISGILPEDDSFISSIRALKVSPGGGAQAVRIFTPTDIPGAFGGHVEAAQVAGVSVWVPLALNGKSGRTFWPGVPELGLDNNRFTSDYKSAMSTLLTGMIADGIKGDNWNFVLCLKLGPSPFTYPNVANGYLAPSPGTMRKRLVPF